MDLLTLTSAVTGTEPPSRLHNALSYVLVLPPVAPIIPVARGYSYTAEGYKDEEAIYSVVPRCCQDTSLAFAAKMTAYPAPRANYVDEAGYSSRTRKHMITRSRSILQRLGRSIHVFRYDGRIGMVIGSDLQEGLEEISEAEASILMI